MYYNSLQYSFRIWLTSALAVPHVYIIYFFASRGEGAYLPLGGYLTLLLECLLLSLPLWFLFQVALDRICEFKTSLKNKKLIAWAALEGLLLVLFAILINGFGERGTTWASYFDFVLISSVVIAACVVIYPLKSQSVPTGRFNF
ncbi:hypothetical protein [Mucilaginibacter boryungensis]|uniref:Uncharacterized protein n=1 Tax=Mucilaginibacter boryungensis TaxID=768480 RepID=A0ABR9XN34_9SPHI|nr:hypothetical protein [Mucilaginibacter boryungensis]MBE9668636.1 hypothetical protein [Mucilaginibacter boryungensis]